MPIQGDDLVISSVVLRTTELENIVGVGGIPPRSRAFETAVADHLVGALYGTTADVKASQLGRSIIEPPGVFCEMHDRFLYQLCRFRRGCFHFLESGDDMAFLLQGKSHQGGLDPFQSLIGSLAVLSCSQRVKVL